MAQRMLAPDVQPEPERVAALPWHTQDDLLTEIESLIASLPVGERLPKANLASWRSTDEVKHAAALAQQYANAGYEAEPLFTRLGKIACRDNFTEMHAFKHHQATYEEFHATRPSLRWRHAGGRGAGGGDLTRANPGRVRARGRRHAVRVRRQS